MLHDSERTHAPQTAPSPRLYQRNNRWARNPRLIQESSAVQSKLGRRALIPYADRVIGFLRFIGIINAAIWLGGSVFFALFAEPAIFSPAMLTLLEAKNFPYFSGAIAQILAERYYHFHLTCAVIAFLQLLAEW